MPRRNCEAPSENTPPVRRKEKSNAAEFSRLEGFFLSTMPKGEEEVREVRLTLGARICFLSIYSQCRLQIHNRQHSTAARALKVFFLPLLRRRHSPLCSHSPRSFYASLHRSESPIFQSTSSTDGRTGGREELLHLTDTMADRGRPPFVIHLDISSSSPPLLPPPSVRPSVGRPLNL